MTRSASWAVSRLLAVVLTLLAISMAPGATAAWGTTAANVANHAIHGVACIYDRADAPAQLSGAAGRSARCTGHHGGSSGVGGPSAATAPVGVAAEEGCASGLCGLPGKTCFVAGTLIKTEHGRKRIEDVKVGDKVWARNLVTGRDELQRVDRTYVRRAEKLLTLRLAAGSLTTTSDHPFWVESRGWTRAGDLVVGDWLSTPSGHVALLGIESEQRSETVYNFRVVVDHDYYALAGDTPVLVHNANYSLSPRTEPAGDLAKYTQSQTTRDAASHYGSMSNDELIAAINGAEEGEGILVSNNGLILDGHHRWDELLRRVGDGRIDPSTPIRIWGLG